MTLDLFVKFDYNSNRYVVSTTEPVYENCSLWKYTVELPEGYGYFVLETTGKAILTFGSDAYEADMLIHMVNETISLHRVLEGRNDDIFLKTVSKEDLN